MSAVGAAKPLRCRCGAGRQRSIIDVKVRRFGPIVLTALATVMAMIPLSHSALYSSMAISIMGGLIVGTALSQSGSGSSRTIRANDDPEGVGLLFRRKRALTPSTHGVDLR